MFTWLRRLQANRHHSVLVGTALQQISRLDPHDLAPGRMLHGEALIITGVLAAITRLIDGAWLKMERLAARFGAAQSEITALQTQLAQLPQRQNIVAPAHHRRPRQLDSAETPATSRRRLRGFLSGMAGPAVVPGDAIYGDALSTEQSRTEHAEISARIAAEDAEGHTRHHHHVPRIWQWAARLVLFFDVIALSALTITLENVAFDRLTWQQQFADQLQRLLTAICFALFGAIVTAVISHTVGAHTWRYIHRTSPLLAGSAHTRRALIGAWAILGVMSTLMGIAIFARLRHAAAATGSDGSVGLCVALLVGVSGVLAPLVVASVDALHSSPEVLRRAALARIVAAANHDQHALHRQIIDRNTERGTLLEEAGRLLGDTRRRIDAERLPAHQAILILRTTHGYAGEHAAAITYPDREAGFLADLDHEQQLRPLVETLNQMQQQATTPATPTPQLPAPSITTAINGADILQTHQS